MRDRRVSVWLNNAIYFAYEYTLDIVGSQTKIRYHLLLLP